jgi:hypothetical protein
MDSPNADPLRELTPSERELVVAVLRAFPQLTLEQAIARLQLAGM